ncbi:hypothetical protein LTR96_011255 [Exophiala xenobiotica]|nr:hypothetical protein LTR41_011481 [Exophiala xenobiotica]KAK5219784.1 hypothetical protein LTR47_011428 [Exophiala xenobiotica]KAK5243239.1 hypothetical protein LTS06_010950 [Exophiala xenobiotica]KAK5260804.1 hypothetical protein LTR40_003470 [Exophiala xenobiotica]KAK5263318.1 hypothetical protein LTR96_011255 [Exophiala xenobiotica]
MNENSTSQLSGDAIMYIIHHIFLPSQLPQEDDTSSQYETFMVDITIKALRKFKSCHAEHNTGAIDSVINMVNSLKAISDTFDTIPCGIILLHIRVQNASVMLSEEKGSIHVEVFELSPLNRAILTTKGRLRRSFPGCARALSIDVFGRHESLNIAGERPRRID